MLVVLKKTFVVDSFAPVLCNTVFQHMGDYSQLWEEQKNEVADLNGN